MLFRSPVWVTETGWPYTGPDWDEAEASIENAKYYWDEVGCRKLFGKTPTFWYNLRDSNPDNEMKFAITKDLSTTPLFDLSCPTTFDTPDKSETESSAAPSGTSSPSGTGSESASGTGMSPNPTATGGSGSRPGSGSEAGSASDSESDSTSGSPTPIPSDKDSASNKLGASAYAAALAMAGAYLLL